MKLNSLNKDLQWPRWYGPRRNSYIGEKKGEPCLYPVVVGRGFIWGQGKGTYVVLPHPESFILVGS